MFIVNFGKESLALKVNEKFIWYFLQGKLLSSVT